MTDIDLVSTTNAILDLLREDYPKITDWKVHVRASHWGGYDDGDRTVRMEGTIYHYLLSDGDVEWVQVEGSLQRMPQRLLKLVHERLLETADRQRAILSRLEQLEPVE